MKLRLREKAAIVLALAYVACCGCASSSKSTVSEKAVVDDVQNVAASATVDEKVTEGPKLDLKFAPIRPGKPPSIDPPGLPKLYPHGDLLAASISGPTITDIAAKASAASQDRKEAKVDLAATQVKETKPAGLFGVLLRLWPLWIFLLAVLAYKFRGVLLKLVGVP